MRSEPKRPCQHGCDRLLRFVSPIERAEPAKVVLQVVGGNAFEPGDPALESAVIRVGVLNVPGPRTRTPALKFTGSRCTPSSLAAAAMAGEPSGHGMASLWMWGLSAWLRQALDPVSIMKSAVAPDRCRATRIAISSMPRSLRGARPPPRWRGLRLAAWALAFVRAQEKGLVGFDHARQIARLGTSGHDAVSWPVPPSCARWCRLHRGLAGYAGVSSPLGVSAAVFGMRQRAAKRPEETTHPRDAACRRCSRIGQAAGAR
jgi:hypothetical protein